MIAFTLLLVAFSYAALFVAVGTKSRTWKGRTLGWLALVAPLALYLFDYPLVYYQHRSACASAGGLQVLLAPERSDRVRLDGEFSTRASGTGVVVKYSLNDVTAQGLLREFYPQLRVVEAIDHKGPLYEFFAYAVDPASTTGPKKNYRFIKTPLSNLSEGTYVLSKSADTTRNHEQKTEWRLTRNGALYAKWTWFRHSVEIVPLIQAHKIWDCPQPPATRHGDSVLIKLIIQ